MREDWIAVKSYWKLTVTTAEKSALDRHAGGVLMAEQQPDADINAARAG